MATRWGRLYRGTPAEHSLEPAIAALGVPYRTQFPLFQYKGGLSYFPDFLLPSLKLIIEVDDESHTRKAAEDEERTRMLQAALGYRVVRCTNDEALLAPVATVERLTGLKCVAPYYPLTLPALATPTKKGKANGHRTYRGLGSSRRSDHRARRRGTAHQEHDR